MPYGGPSWTGAADLNELSPSAASYAQVTHSAAYIAYLPRIRQEQSLKPSFDTARVTTALRQYAFVALPWHTVVVIAMSSPIADIGLRAQCLRLPFNVIFRLAYRNLEEPSCRSTMRSCFSASMIAKKATPTPIKRKPSNRGTATVPKSACSGGR